MGILGERHAGTFEGHKLEIVRDNLTKRCVLLIDGVEVASESRAVPHDITLTATFEHAGVTHKVVARSIVKGLSATDSIEIDRKPLSITKNKT